MHTKEYKIGGYFWTRSIGEGNLPWKELQDVILDVEVALNNRHLDYIENDVQLPVLIPNALLFGQPNAIPELKSYNIQETDLRKRLKYLRKCNLKHGGKAVVQP